MTNGKNHYKLYGIPYLGSMVIEFLMEETSIKYDIIFPTSVEPVKATLSINLWFVKISPVLPSPVTIFITPFGILAFSHNSQKYKAVKEVNSAGFKTTVLPHAIAGAIFHDNINNGKFQGII